MIEGHIHAILQEMELLDEETIDTPRRFQEAFLEMTSGYLEKPDEILSKTFDGTQSDEIIVVKGIPFHSLCEHHLLPFNGTVHVGYLPNGKIVGLSKIPRLVQCFARRLQIQERLTVQISGAIMEHLKPRGVGCVIEAHHTCMSMRGIKSQGKMLTSSMLGCFREKSIKDEFLSMVR